MITMTWTESTIQLSHNNLAVGSGFAYSQMWFRCFMTPSHKLLEHKIRLGLVCLESSALDVVELTFR